MRQRLSYLGLILFSLYGNKLTGQDIPSPTTYFGFQMGSEGKIIDFYKGLEYYKLLAAKSDKILYRELGKTTDGNPFVLLTISSPDNLKRLNEINKQRDLLNDPRKITDAKALELARSLPAVVFHTSSIHSTEISTAQVVPELVYDLLSQKDEDTRKILDNLIILVSPSANPDGQVKVKTWYEANKGKPWEARMPWLYQTYVGHDNNRDWVLLHFPAQRLTAEKIFLDWHPIYSLEMHQMGGNGARLFVPPYQEPYDENTAPEVVETMSLVGMSMSYRLTTENKGGVVKNAIFDLFTPARAFQIYRGTARVLTETASANFASKITWDMKNLQGPGRSGAGTYDPERMSWNYSLPWQGGDWTFRTMVEYQLSANFAALNLVADHPEKFNYSQYRSLRRPLDNHKWPYAYIIPKVQRDPSSVEDLLQTLQRGGIEIEVATSPIDIAGQKFNRGDYIVKLAQPYGAWAKTLLEIQHYPDLRRSPTQDPIVPYDVTSSTLPLMMGVKAVKVQSTFKANVKQVKTPIHFKGIVEGKGTNGFVILPNSNDAYAIVDELLDKGMEVSRIELNTPYDGSVLINGGFLVPQNSSSMLSKLAENRYFKAVSIQKSELPKSTDLHRLRNPRIGIYEPWGGLIDAGWTRLVLEQWSMEPKIIHDDIIRNGELNDLFDVIIFPAGLPSDLVKEDTTSLPIKYKRGLGDAGTQAMMTFVRKGGFVLSFGNSAAGVIHLFDLPIANAVAGMPSKQFYAPGSLVLTNLDPDSPLSYGLPDKIAVLDRNGPVLVPAASVIQEPHIIGQFPKYDARLSGFLLGEEQLRGKGSIALQELGQGKVILFAMAPQFRAMTHGSYKLIFNAIFWSATD